MVFFTSLFIIRKLECLKFLFESEDVIILGKFFHHLTKVSSQRVLLYIARYEFLVGRVGWTHTLTPEFFHCRQDLRATCYRYIIYTLALPPDVMLEMEVSTVSPAVNEIHMYIHIYNHTCIHTLIPPGHCPLSFQSPQLIVTLLPRSCPTILNGY